VRTFLFLAVSATTAQIASFEANAQSAVGCERVTRLGQLVCHDCQEPGKDVTNAWNQTVDAIAERKQCINTLCAHPDNGPRTIESAEPAPVTPSPVAAYYCGLDQPSRWVTLQHASTSARTYRQAAMVNPYSAIALFSARTELSTDAEPNRFSLGAGTLILERSFTTAEVIRGIEAETRGHPLTDLGSSLPPNAFITVISARVPERDDPVTGAPGGFKISAYLENSEGHRTVLGEPAIVFVGAPRKSVASTGESVEIFEVTEVVSAPSR
jgi:hypothetical protein